MNNSDNITFYSHNDWVFKVIQAMSVVIWMDSEQISPVCVTVWYLLELNIQKKGAQRLSKTYFVASGGFVSLHSIIFFIG